MATVQIQAIDDLFATFAMDIAEMRLDIEAKGAVLLASLEPRK